jgi:hypothetical protein
MWHKYIQLGYYVFDDCMDFHRTWKSTAKEAILQRYKVIWKSYHIHRMNDIPINETLQKSALTTAHPFLQSKDPDFLLATDIEFEEKEFFRNQDLGATPPNPDSEWTPVGSKKNKKKSPTTSPTILQQRHPHQLLSKILSVDTAEIPNEALMRLPLARPTTQPASNTLLHNQSTGDTAASYSTPAVVIHNPYTRSRNDTTKLADKAPATAPTDEPPNESRPIAFIDLINDAASPSTTTTTETDPCTQPDPSPHTSPTPPAPLPPKPKDHISLNDGTLRITIRWKPQNYDELANDSTLWQQQSIVMLQDILHHPLSPIFLVPWLEKFVTNTTLTNITSLSTHNLAALCSPKTSNLTSYKMFVFGIRICATDPTFSTGTWLNDVTVKQSLDKHQVALSISNSTCDSGKMVTAGSILLKHPQYTHRLYFLRALRRHLPLNTPFSILASINAVSTMA